MAAMRSAGDAWVECRGAVRTLEGEFVDCPVRGKVDHRVCLDCRFLMSSSSERQWSEWCVAEGSPPKQGSISG
jgi:hypothetical protein